EKQMRKTRWLKEQEGRKKQKNFRIFKTTVLALFLALAGLFVFFFGREIGFSRWEGAENVNIVFVHDSPVILSFSPSKKTISAIIIPPETQIETAMGYGFYKANSIFNLDKMEKKKGDLFVLSMEKFLAVPISAWIYDEKFQQEKASDYRFWWKAKNLPYLLSSYKKRWETNLNPFEVIRFWWFARGVKEEKTNTIDLRDLDIFTPLTLFDGIVVLTADYGLMDSYSRKIFEESLVKKENLKTEISNATDFPGLASFAARVLKNIGMDIVSVGNFDEEKQPLSQIKVFSGLEKSPSRRLMEKIFLGGKKTSGQGGNPQADITLILGEDYGKKIYGKKENGL
ncbi:MAG: LytR C-terminal domain-containing protein, partial [bacterium]|nr:LytR C-terminal domain-containing protein [bacterium]